MHSTPIYLDLIWGNGKFLRIKNKQFLLVWVALSIIFGRFLMKLSRPSQLSPLKLLWRESSLRSVLVFLLYTLNCFTLTCWAACIVLCFCFSLGCFLLLHMKSKLVQPFLKVPRRWVPSSYWCTIEWEVPLVWVVFVLLCFNEILIFQQKKSRAECTNVYFTTAFANCWSCSFK